MRSNVEQLFEANDLANLKNCNYYDLLSLDKNAIGEAFSYAVVKRYRQLALRFHPDVNAGDATKAEIFKLINEAYSTLNDTQNRIAYDCTLSEIANSRAGNTTGFFHTPENTAVALPTDIYCFFHAQMNDWKAFGWEANITVTNERANVRFTLSGHILPVKCLVFSQNERYLASADMDNVIKVWDLSSRQCLQSFTATTRRISHLFFSDNSEWLFSGEENQIFESTRKIEAWDFKNGRYLGIFSGFYHVGKNEHGDEFCMGFGITHLAISEDGRIVSGTTDDYCEDTPDGASGNGVNDDEDGNPAPLIVEHHSQATTGCANEIIVPIWPTSVAKPIYLDGYEFNAGKTHVLVREKLALTLWDLKTETLLLNQKIDLSEKQAKADCCVACAFNPISEIFAIGVGGDVRIMDYQGRVHQMFCNPDVIEELHFTYDGKFLISQRRDSVFLHDFATRESCSLRNQSIQINCVNITSDSQKILIISRSRRYYAIEMVDIVSRRCLFRHELKYDGVKNSRLLSIGADVTVFHHDLSKDDQTIALGLSDNSVRLLDLNTFEMAILRGHRGDVLRVAFSPNNQWLVTASRDNSICVWDYKQRTLVQQLSTGCTLNIIFVNNHRFLFDIGKQIKTWNITTEKMDDVCHVSMSHLREKLFYTDGILFFENERGLLTKVDISSVLMRLDRQVALTCATSVPVAETLGA